MSIPVLVIGNYADYFVSNYQQQKVNLTTHHHNPFLTLHVGTDEYDISLVQYHLDPRNINQVEPNRWVQECVISALIPYLDHDRADITYRAGKDGIEMSATVLIGNIVIRVKSIQAPIFGINKIMPLWDEISVHSI